MVFSIKVTMKYEWSELQSAFNYNFFALLSCKASEYYMNDNFNDVDTYVPQYAYNQKKTKKKKNEKQNRNI